MTDSVLVQNGFAHQVWRGIERLGLPPMHPSLIAEVVEVPDNTVNEGDSWDGTKFTPAPPPTPPPFIVPYEKFRAALTDVEKAALHTAMASTWQVEDFVGLARAQNGVNLSNATAPLAKAALVAANVLTQDRADTLFNEATWK